MAFALTAYLGSDSLALTTSPYTLLRATGMGGANVRRVVSQGPGQDGDTDLGYRLGPRDIELVIGIEATTDALLDGYRDDLIAIFKPLPSTPVILRVTRDDATERQIDCYLRGEIGVSLTPIHRPGHYHRFTIPLRAADPAFYDTTSSSETTSGVVVFIDNWWLAGGAIGTAQVLMHGTAPALNEAWSYTGTIPAGTSWELAVRAEYVASTGTVAGMFSPSGDIAEGDVRFLKPTYKANAYYFGPFGLANNGMASGNRNYFNYSDGSKQYWVFPGGTAYTTPAGSVNASIMAWRTLGWSGSVPLYALYQPSLSTAQRAALGVYMNGTAGTATTTIAIPYVGDLPEYPIISLTGPISSPSITNTSTGEVLDFGTITIGAGTTYVVDTRYGYKTVKAGTVDRKYELTDDSDLGEWHIAPAPVAPGGTNVIVVGGSASGSALQVEVTYYNRYSSF